MTRRPWPLWVPVLVLFLTVAQLAVAEWWPGIDRFADKAFGARLVAYPLLMLLAPAVWWLVVRRRDETVPAPYAAFTLIMLPFLVDVTHPARHRDQHRLRGHPRRPGSRHARSPVCGVHPALAPASDRWRAHVRLNGAHQGGGPCCGHDRLP